MTIALADKRKKHFSDFSTEPPPMDGVKIKLDDILNREIEIVGFRLGTTKYSKNKSGKYLTLQIHVNDETRVVFSGSDVLISQLEKYAPEIPFLTTILKVNRYYSLS